MIAFMLCLCMGRSFHFNLFDMDEIQQLLQVTERVDDSVDDMFFSIISKCLLKQIS